MTDRQPARVKHKVERTYRVAATPEQVWAAIATAEGITAWMTPTRLDPRIDGQVSFDFGDFVSNGVVTDYTPNERFAYEEPWPMTDAMRAWVDSLTPGESVTDGALARVSPIATEFLIEAESGGSTVIRVVSSAFGSGADWEHEFFAQMLAGWIPLLDRLAASLAAGAGAT